MARRRGKGHCQGTSLARSVARAQIHANHPFQRGARQPSHRPHIFNELNFSFLFSPSSSPFLPSFLPTPQLFTDNITTRLCSGH